MAKKKAPKSAPTFQLWLGIGVLLLVVIAVMVANVRHQRSVVHPASPSPSTTASATPVPSPSGGGGGGSTPQPTPRPTPPPTLDAPILQLSSGNHGSVPAGAVIEFVCRTLSSQDCTLILTNKSSGQVVTLSKQTTKSDGRGSYGTTWDWTAQSGTWAVKATATKDGATASSAEQTLTVQ